MLERLVIGAGLLLAAHFCMSYIVPAPAGGRAWLIFPFARTGAVTTWTFGRIAGFPLVPMLGLAGCAVIAFFGAFLAALGWWLSAESWRPLVLIGTICSAILFVLHLGPWAIAPLALDGVMFWLAWTATWAPPTPA
jgi:hypothetical protein